jgi:hypothetical protein
MVVVTCDEQSLHAGTAGSAALTKEADATASNSEIAIVMLMLLILGARC